MICYKFGMLLLVKCSLGIYISVIIEVMLFLLLVFKDEWCELMKVMVVKGCDFYCGVVCQDLEFVLYFCVVMLEQELGKLFLGSCFVKCKFIGGIESLCVILWIFVWVQICLVLLVWLGSMCVIDVVCKEGNEEILKEMLENWLFFKLCLFMLDMVFQKVDFWISEEYDDCLVFEEFKYFGVVFCVELKEVIVLLLEINGQEIIMELDLQGCEFMNICVVYFELLYYLQIELLLCICQLDEDEYDVNLDKVMMVVISGIVIGM